jgi:hypothetical protein
MSETNSFFELVQEYPDKYETHVVITPTIERDRRSETFIRVLGLITNGKQLFAVASYDPPTAGDRLAQDYRKVSTFVDVTKSYLYDLTESKLLYGGLPDTLSADN